MNSPDLDTALVVAGVAAAAAAVAVAPMAARYAAQRRLGRLCAERRTLVLTYDDGPGERMTPRVLDALAAHGARASFFCLGHLAERRPEILDRAVREGHEVGSHSYAHLHAWKTAPWNSVRDTRRGFETLARWVPRDGLFRPPYGKLTIATWALAKSRGARFAWWTRNSGDTWDEIEADLRDSLGIRAPVAPDAPPAEEPTLPDDTQEEAISNYRVRQLRKSAQKFASDENKPYHVVYRKDDRGESYEVMDDDQYSMYHKTHTKKYTYRPMKKTEARLKAPPPAASAPEAPPEYTVMRKPYAHQSQCSRCGYEGRVYEYGHDYPGKGIQWMPGKFCGKSCYYGYHDSKSQMPPAASAMGEDMKTESGPPEPGSAAYRARVALRLAAGGGNPKKIMEDLFGDGPDIGAQNQSSMYMVIQPNDKVTVTGPDGQPMAAVAIRKTDDGSGWVLDVQGAQGLASKETVVSVASPVADMDQGFGPEPGGMEDEFGDEGEPEPEPDGDEGFPPDEDDGSVSAGPAEVDIEEPEDEES